MVFDSKTPENFDSLELLRDSENVFDNMLADYFVESKQEHKKGNRLLKQLEDFFSSFNEPLENHGRSGVKGKGNLKGLAKEGTTLD